ncbi:MAG: aminopeptidase [Peptococcaceae bacterium]|nr:aminopeptidase [Peptococcaceae bacterium]
MDPRFTKLAQNIISYSVSLQPGESILIDNSGADTGLARALIKETYRVGGFPYYNVSLSDLQRELLLHLSEDQARAMARWDLAQMRDIQAYVGIRAGANVNELADVPAANMQIYSNLYSLPVHMEQRVKHSKWCVLRYPNPSMAQLAEMSTEAFADFYFQVCAMNYAQLSAAMDPLCALMETTDKVRLLGPGTDLSFSIKGIGAVKCDGTMNLPDGEVYSAPVKTSVNGTISYNTPAVYQGFTYESIVLEFQDGKIIRATANNTEKINHVFDTDDGARYVGEFAIGVNPFIKKPMRDTLFDEKIDGSLHFTPGKCYDDADNGNTSAIHWDLVLIQRSEFGGGEIYFDDVCIRRDGRFIHPNLLALNSENFAAGSGPKSHLES